MKKLEPLLKEEEEKFAFQIKEEKKKVKPGLIMTVILGIVTLMVTCYSFAPIALGIIYFDEYHNKDKNKVKETEVPVEADIVNKVYNYIDVTNSNELANMFQVIYGRTEIKNETLSKDQKMMLLFSYMGIDCNNLELNTSLEEMKRASINLFNDDSYLNDLEKEYKINDFVLTSNENGYNLTKGSCAHTDNYTYKEITKVTMGEDYLFIYERFGYFSIYANTYEVYTDALKTRKISTYSTQEKDGFKELDLLGEYKWTFKKGNDNNYYFVSITPTI